MRKTITILGVAFMLGGCAHAVPSSAIPKQHYGAKPAVIAPSPQQTFKQRWLRKFFRNRAVAK